MCGRYNIGEIDENLYVASPSKMFDPKPRYNVAPSQLVPAIRLNEAGQREAVMLKWGLIPRWAKDPKVAWNLINARAETVTELKSFREAFRQRHCLILADAFYEWKKEGEIKQPYCFQLKDFKPFAFAGLWESWKNPAGKVVETCTIITCEANEVVRPVHSRMPVILPREDEQFWLDAKTANSDLLLAPLPAEQMVGFEVSTYVNSPKNTGPDCVYPIKF